MDQLSFNTLFERLPTDIKQLIKDCYQDPIYHNNKTVYEHTQEVFENVLKLFPENNLLLIAAIFHDIAKPETKQTRLQRQLNLEYEPYIERVTHYEHEKEAEKYIDEYCYLFEDITTDIEGVKQVVRNHMKAHLFMDGQIKKQKKIIDFLNNPYLNDILKFEQCDVKY